MESNTTQSDWNVTGFENVTDPSHDDENFDDKKTFVFAASFLCVVIFVAVVLRECLDQYHFPYTVPLIVFGAVLGVLDRYFEYSRSFTALARNDIIIQLFLPVLIYDYAFGMNPHMFVVALGQCMILAVFGFAFCTSLNAAFAKAVLSDYDWDWLTCILFGAILSVTDPSAIIELLKEYGVKSSLLTIIKGESMLNSGIALVLSKTLLKIIGGMSLTIEAAILDVFMSCLGGVAFGYILAMAVIMILRNVENDTDMEVTLPFCTAYIAYFVSDYYLNVSGILAVVVLGVSLSSYKSSVNYEEEETTVHLFWQTLDFWAKSLTFTIVGYVITSNDYLDFDSQDIGFIISTYFTASVIRGCMIFGLNPLLRKQGYGFTWKCGALLTWGGMRGAVGLAMALLSKYTLQPNVMNKLLIQVSGVIVLTLIFNASTMRWLLKLIGIGQITDKNVESMANAIALLRDAVHTTEKVIRMDKYSAGVDWAWVHKVTHIENPYEEKNSVQSTMKKRAFEAFRGHCKGCKTEIRIEPNSEERKLMEAESRLSILRALKISVANQHEGYGILRRTLGHLNTSIDNALDVPDKYLLVEDIKKKFLSIGYIVRFMKRHMIKIMQKLDLEVKQSKSEIHRLTEVMNATRFRKWCINIYISRRFQSTIYWILLFNIVPIVGEFFLLFTAHRWNRDSDQVRKEILFFEILNALLTLVYVWDAVIRIGALGCKSYFNSRGNIIDFTVTSVAVAQIIYVIFLFSANLRIDHHNSFYVLVSLSAFRLVRLIRVACFGIFAHILNQFCSAFYNAFDLAIGFIVANEEIAKNAHKIVEYEKGADYARVTAEQNIYEMLCFVGEIEKDHPYVARAWRTHRATIYVLRNMKEVIEDMVKTYILDESDAEELLDEINSRLNETLSCVRYMKVKDEVTDSLNNIQWIINDDILIKILENHSIRKFSKGEVIQEAGKMHLNLKVLYKGIIKISGSHAGEKESVLPNADTIRYFCNRRMFLSYVRSPQPIGLLAYLLQTPSVTSVTSTTDSEFITIDFDTISQIERQFGSLSFHMWRSIALQIAFVVLKDEKEYENWSDERLKIHLEEGVFPNLNDEEELDVDSVITDIVLIQGKVKVKNKDTIYIGPAYIPNSVRSVDLLGNHLDRPFIVMVLLREEKYHAPSVMGWTEMGDITNKGICPGHGIRKASVNMQQSNMNASRRGTFVQTLLQFFKPKDRNILRSSSDDPENIS